MAVQAAREHPNTVEVSVQNAICCTDTAATGAIYS
jgi:hypothetical protein